MSGDNIIDSHANATAQKRNPILASMMSKEMERLMDEAVIQHLDMKDPRIAKEVRAKLNVKFHLFDTIILGLN